ncbi:MAG: endonuclease III [Thermodesulfobacteriota bacterium]
MDFQREEIGSKKKRVKKIIYRLKNLYPSPKCHLNYSNPLELLVGCILSAQCTDRRVNEVTKHLFKKYKTAADYAEANQRELENEIRTTGFFRNKAKSIIRSTRALNKKYDGNIPTAMEKLTELDGVGRKTANVVLGNAFGEPAIIVDTHIKRFSRRLNLSNKNDPDKIEFDIRGLVPRDNWTFFSLALGDHGRTICKARNPQCKICMINKHCPSADLGG